MFTLFGTFDIVVVVIIIIIIIIILLWEHAVAYRVDALTYKTEGHRFEFR
jgi:hypothetical protein